MKSLTKKISIGVLSGLFAVGAVGAGISALALNGDTSNSPLSTNLAGSSTYSTTVRVGMVEDNIVPGGTVTFEFNISTTRTSTQWDSIDMFFAPLTSEGAPDTEIAKCLSITGSPVQALDLGVMQDNPNYVSDGCSNFLSSDGYFAISIAARATGTFVSSSTALKFTLTLNVSKELEEVARIKSALEQGETPEITFGLIQTDLSYFKYKDNGYDTTHPWNNYGLVISLDYTGQIIQAHSETDITEITITVDDVDEDGNPTEKKEVLDVDPLNPHDVLNVLLGDTPKKSVHIDPPKLTDDSAGAKVSAGATNDPTKKPSTMIPMTDEGVDVPLTDTNHYIYVEVVSEDGSKTEHYPINAIFTYVRLDSLSVSSDSQKVNGALTIEPEFDSDTFTYTVKYPGDANVAILSASVVDGYNANTSIALAPSICRIQGNATSFVSGSVVGILNAGATGAQVVLTVYSMAHTLHLDSSAYKEYTVKFEKLSVEAELKNVTVTSATSGNLCVNDPDKADDAGTDYYFTVAEASAQAKMELTLSNGATATISGEGLSDIPYDPETVYGIGEYTITVTAEAGNTETYTVTLAKFDSVKLSLTSEYEFLFEETQNRGAVTFNFRMSYSARGMVHGVDDLDFERVVLGHVLQKTSLNSFLTNFDSEQLPQIKIYDGEDTLIYDCGTIQPPFDRIADNGGILAVGTGWRVEYGTGDGADVIYISVLGDIDGNGLIGSSDTSALFQVIQRLYELDKVEFRLAAYVSNMGRFGSGDVSDVYTLIQQVRTEQEFFVYDF